MSTGSPTLKNVLLILLIIILLPIAFGTCVLCVATMNVATDSADAKLEAGQ